MKDIPSGNAAISIAHPSHELRIHGFISRTKPFAFIMTDGADKNNTPSFFNFQKYFGTVHSGNNDAFLMVFNANKCITDENIYIELVSKKHQFFEGYIKLLASNMLRKQIDYVVADSSEGYSVSHEACRMCTDLAIRYIQKINGKKIESYDFAIVEKFDSVETDDCIHIQLTEQEYDDKLKHFSVYHPCAFKELKSNVSVDISLIESLQQIEGGMQEIKNTLKTINKSFFSNEFIRPYIYKKLKPMAGLEEDVIKGFKQIGPMKKKLESVLGLK